jgi:5-methylthioadenosine/S-adenosylhomocysteine deaminase
MLMHRRLAAGADLSCTSGTTGEISKAELAAERGRGVIPSEESPPDLVLRGAHVLTLAPGCKPIPKGGLAVRGGVIVAVGPDDELEGLAARARRVVDGGDSALIPGLINAHSHVACTQHRGLIENLALEPWLQAVWAVESHYVTPQTTFLGALIGLAELLLSGVTTTIDMFWLGEPAAEAAKRLGMRISTGSWFFDGPSVCGVDAADWPKRAESFFDRWAGDDLVIPGCFPHAAYTVGPESLRQAHAIAERRGGLFSTHAAETRAEQRIIAERHGRTVIRHLDALGLLGPRTVLAHCVHLDDGEIELLARSGATVSHNPVSNLKLGSGIARIPDMLAAGVRVAIGTDSCISGNDIDMWLSMRLSALLPKGAREDPTLISPLETLAMATRNGAAALGLEDRLGTLEIGKQADFALVSLRSPHATPLYDLATHLVYSANRSDVTDVFVAGRQVVEDRRIVALDIEAPLAEMRALGARIAARAPL